MSDLKQNVAVATPVALQPGETRLTVQVTFIVENYYPDGQLKTGSATQVGSFTQRPTTWEGEVINVPIPVPGPHWPGSILFAPGQTFIYSSGQLSPVQTIDLNS